ncbi:MAG: CAP domain-containing protein [Chlorobi bacterium]|nr:CAP domain-containing protein [Chlorobiota bacterium]
MQFQVKKIVFLIMIIAFTGGICFAGYPAANWNISQLNTGVNARYLSQLSKEVILEINKLRSDPAKYAADYIDPLKHNYKGKLFYYAGDKPLLTKEGVKALYECVRFLKRQKPVPILKPHKGLSKAASDHVADQSKHGGTGHTGTDKSGMKSRIERYGQWKSRIAENITYGDINAQQIVIYLLIDDGIYSRGHRKNFLNEKFEEIGVATGTHPQYGKMCVMDFAGSFQNHTSK